MRLLDQLGDLAEHADEMVPVVDRDRADLDRDALAVRRDYLDWRIGDLRGTDHLPREELPCPPRVLRRDDGRELAAPNVSDDVASGGVQPPDDPARVDVVAGHVDVLENLFEMNGVEGR